MDEEWPDDILAVTCMRVDKMESVVPGSLVKTCWRCECSIWLSPATLAHVRGQRHRLICMDCMMHFAAQDKDAEVAPLSDAQKEELSQALRNKGSAWPGQIDMPNFNELLQRPWLYPPGKDRPG